MYYFIMKIPNKWKLQQIAFSYSTDILFKGFMDIYKKCTAKPFSFFVIHGTFASDNLSRFRKNLLEKKLKLIVAIDDKIKEKKVQYDINRETAKISVLWSGKIDKY